MSIQNISFLGAGSIAEAIIGGLLHANVVKGEQITVSNRSNETRLQELHNKYGVKGTHNKKELLTNTNILFLAMKPKDVAEALTPFKEDIHNNLLIISLLAGVSTHSIRNLLQKRRSDYSCHAKYICSYFKISYCYLIFKTCNKGTYSNCHSFI